MKRSTWLSALLVTLSVTSLASAAPENPSTSPAQGAPTAPHTDQADPAADVAQTDTAPTATPSNAPAAGDGAGTGTTQPAVSIGTSATTAPATDSPQQAPAEAKKPKPRPFAGTQLYNQNSMSTATVFRGQQQDWNPTVESNLWFLPRYAINEAFQLRARAIVTYEYTNSDSTKYRNEPMLSDTTFQLFYRKIPEFAGFKPMVALNAGLPTSKVSQARTMIFTPGVTVQLSRAVEHVLGGELMLLGSLGYSHPLYQSEQAQVVDARPPGSFTCAGGTNCQDLLGGALNPSDTLAYMFLVAGEWGKWSPALLYFGGSQWVYTPKEVKQSEVVPGGNNAPVAGVVNPVGVRQTHYFNAFVDYHLNGWLTPEVGYFMSRSVLNEAGKFGNPFFDRYQDMRVYVGFNVNIDNLMKELEGGEVDAGIVRAHNTKRPMWTF